MKISMGECYKNANGDRIEIVSILQEDAEEVDYPVIGWVFMKGCVPYLATYTKEGRFLGSHKDERDLVGLWEEPEFQVTEPGEYICRDKVKAYVTNLLPPGYLQPVKGYRTTANSLFTWGRDGAFVPLSARVVESVDLSDE